MWTNKYKNHSHSVKYLTVQKISDLWTVKHWMYSCLRPNDALQPASLDGATTVSSSIRLTQFHSKMSAVDTINNIILNAHNYDYLCVFLQGSHSFSLKNFPRLSIPKGNFPWPCDIAQQCIIFYFYIITTIRNTEILLTPSNTSNLLHYINKNARKPESQNSNNGLKRCNFVFS